MDSPIENNHFDFFKDFYGSFSINDVEIKLERGLCFGTCPAYTLHLFGTGSLIYIGESNVEQIGQIRIDFPQEKVFQLLKKAFEIEFFSMRDLYSDIEEMIMSSDGQISIDKNCMTDLPIYTPSIKIQNYTKSIEDYLGAPLRLREFENYIDEICESHRWTGVHWEE